MFIKRSILKEIEGNLEKKEIIIIIGPQQVGKTTILKFLIEKLKREGKKAIYLSLDYESDKKHFNSQEALLQKINLEIGKEGYVFIDEIQRKEDAGLFLKGIYDKGFNYKFIVTGSGSLELKEKIQESLVGRKRLFELTPINFEEFINFKTEYCYENRLGEFFQTEKEKTILLLDEYLNFGGYPKVVLENEKKEKQIIIDEIFRSYLEKDISFFLNVEKIEAFSELVKILAAQIGRLVNYSELCNILNISIHTLKNYLWFLEKTFIIKKVSPYFRNVKKEIRKSPVYYFYDLGLRNYALGLLGDVSIPDEKGFLFQNFIFNILNEKFRYTNTHIHFWRTQDKAEVDFLLDTGLKVIPVEVKYKNFTKPQIERSLKSFINKYHPDRAIIINLNFEYETFIEGTKLIFLPFWKIFDFQIFKI